MRGLEAAAERVTRHMETLTRRLAVTAAIRPNGIRFRTGLLEQLNDHAIALAVQHGITVTRSHDGPSWGSQELKQICASAVTSDETYCVFLHEVGHVVSPEADSRQYRNFVEKGFLYAAGGELGAWRFAVKHALTWTAAMQHRLEESLQHHPAFTGATPDEEDAIVDLRAWARARVSGAGALLAWRQREYQPGERVVHGGRAWVARCFMPGHLEWSAPGRSPVLWEKD